MVCNWDFMSHKTDMKCHVNFGPEYCISQTFTHLINALLEWKKTKNYKTEQLFVVCLLYSHPVASWIKAKFFIYYTGLCEQQETESYCKYIVTVVKINISEWKSNVQPKYDISNKWSTPTIFLWLTAPSSLESLWDLLFCLCSQFLSHYLQPLTVSPLCVKIHSSLC